ncbi:MAG TPA: aldehyde dehydrogenase family protein [Candidatus Latescibacteria bacterium]|jgi:glyceraldehyde-3-phosphate dehydrogenase (NADP+)|nr:aldehyde dehydrogenase family protein [Candidatus Latescibacterota bacterium]HJP30835.1 aldehyde dehydrogenase family protein [Candidatus Latescibacterota bacterium]
MKMHIGGQWLDKDEKIEVQNPYDGSVIDTVPKSTPDDVSKAIATAQKGAQVMRRMPAYERYQLLDKAARLMYERQDDLGRTITMEEGKVIAEGVGEAGRSAETITLSAEEAKRLTGETLDLSAASNGVGKFGFTLRVPCGVVAAITPFNFPLNLVCHKVGPALAAGNAVVVKPASDTPLSAIKLVEILLEAGFPPEAVSVVTGSGSTIGDAVASDPRVRKISFTGSRDVGEHICRTAGLKKVTMELGSNSPVVVMDDADLDKVADGVALAGFANAGQVCISAQRILVQEKAYDDFTDALKSRVEGITTGDPLTEATKMGPMIRESDAERVESWVQDAVAGGARLVAGGSRSGTMHQPTILADVEPGMRVSCDEIFGPAVALTRVGDIDRAIAIANDTNYGLSASIFTQDIDRAIKYAQNVDSGNIHINWGTMWRADMMPYGGVKDSGMGKEGPKYTVQEMTETKMVVIH